MPTARFINDTTSINVKSETVGARVAVASYPRAMEHDKLANRDLADQHPISAITGLESALDDKVEKTDTASKVYGTDSEGNQTLYDAGSFGQVDDVRVNGVSVVENKIANLGTMALENASDYSTKAVADTLYASISYEATIDNHIVNKNNPHEVNKAQVGLGNVDNTSDLNKPISTATQTALSGKQNSLDTTQMAAVNSGANTTNISQIATNTQAIANEVLARENADNNLQGQIDAITAASDVTDIVGTYAELQAYDTTSLPNNSIIKVLQDESRDDETTYYRWVITDGVGSWVLIGEEGPYLTIAGAASTYVPQTRTINNKALSSNILLTYSDVGADASGAASAAETNAKNYADSLASNYATAAQGAKADTALQSGDNISELVNNSGYITGISSSDVTTALGYTPYDSSNPSGYTDNVGTVTSVNNTSPDVNGNVTLSIPAAQVNSDWDAVSGVAQILNKPTIPTVNDSTISFTQGGVSKGSFTLNQSTGATIALDAGGGSDVEAFTAAEVQTIWDNN